MSSESEQDFANDVIRSTGFTFENFKKNPDKWRPNKNEWFDAAEQGELIVNYKKQKYFVRLPSGNRYECETLAKVEKIFAAEGYKKEHVFFKSVIREGATTDRFCEVTWEVKPECLR
jgi:hypothetical protein